MVDKTDSSEVSISWKQAVAMVLMAVFTITLPGALVVKSFMNVAADKEQAAAFLHKSLLSDRELPFVIKKAMEYEAWTTRIDAPLEPRLIKAAISGIDRKNMIELFDYIAPEKERKALLENIASAFYSWIDGDDVYPSLTIQTGRYLSNIKSNAENLLPWIYKSFPIPACSPGQIEQLERGDHNKDLQSLAFCIPPEALQMKIAPIGAALIKEKLLENNLPASINITDKIKEKNSPEKMAAAKKKIHALFFQGSNLWLLPVAMLLIALLLAARSVKSAIAWLSWPFTFSGLSGMLLVSCLPGLSFLHSVPKDVPDHIPGAAIGIGRKLGIDMALLLENCLFTPFTVMALAGVVMVAFAFRKHIGILLSKTRLSLGLIFRKQPA